jgi:hypothetical protein
MSRYIKNSIGLEHRQESVSFCELQGLHVVQGYLLDMPMNLNHHQPFASFGIFNYLEHIPDVTCYMSTLRQYLLPDAVGIVEVPNFNLMLENSVYSDFSAEHLSYFTKETLTTALELSGFQVLSLAETWHGHILTAEVVRRSSINLSIFSSKLEEDRADFLRLLNPFKSSEVAVWGAGHQSLAFLAQLSLVNYIGFIVDSSIAKQNKYAPGSGIPILAPESLSTRRPKLLIVNASSYNCEVVDTVFNTYDFIPRICVVDNGKLCRLR